MNNLINKKTIVIIGRGPSARFYKKKLNSHFIIGVNFEKLDNIIFDGVFKKNYINLIDSKKKIYLTSRKLYKIGSVNFSLFNLLNYLNDNFLNKKILLYGFDFKKNSKDEDILKEKRILSDKENIQENIDINTQLYAFNNFRNRFCNLRIFKFGYDFHSDFNYSNKLNNKLEIISEFTTNHQGNTEKLVDLLDSVIAAGCKVIKFQKRDVESFYSKKILKKKFITPISNNFYEYRKNLELNSEQLDIIKYYKKKKNLKVIFSALDIKSYLELKKDSFKYFKIPSTISGHKKFINYIAKKNKYLTYISTGMTNQKYLDYILNLFKKKKIVLMHAVSSYPTKFENMNLNIIKLYSELSKNNKNIIPGYSSHDIGDLGSMFAVTCGAKVIEKHVKIGVTNWMHFDDTAIDAKNELPLFINSLNKTYAALGDTKKKIYDFEHHKYSANKK